MCKIKRRIYLQLATARNIAFFIFFLFVLDVPHLTNEHRTQDCIAS